jgi:hypothetical protein
MRHFGDADTPAIFEPAKLLELLNFFEFTLGKSGIFEQCVALKDVKAEVLPILYVQFLLGVANPGNGSARKIEGIFVEIENGFDDVGIQDVVGVADGRGDRGDLRRRIFQKAGDGGVNAERVDERLVALDIDEDVARFVCGNFGDTLGAGTMIGASHASAAAERLDRIDNPLVIRGYQHFMDSLGPFGPFVDVLDHWFAAKGDKGLTGETRGTVTGRNHNNDGGIGHSWELSAGLFEAMLTQGSSRGCASGQECRRETMRW